jgi:hypothetical protein
MKTLLTLQVLAFAAAFILIPLGLLWALNTLFPILAIAYSLKTWAAAAVLLMFLNSNRTPSKK